MRNFIVICLMLWGPILNAQSTLSESMKTSIGECESSGLTVKWSLGPTYILATPEVNVNSANPNAPGKNGGKGNAGGNGKGNSRIIDSSSVAQNDTSSFGLTYNEDVKIYPNPTSGLTKVDFSSFSNSVSIQVFDQLGRSLIYKTEISGGIYELNLQALERGSYLIRVSDSSKTQTSIIQKT